MNVIACKAGVSDLGHNVSEPLVVNLGANPPGCVRDRHGMQTGASDLGRHVSEPPVVDLGVNLSGLVRERHGVQAGASDLGRHNKRSTNRSASGTSPVSPTCDACFKQWHNVWSLSVGRRQRAFEQWRLSPYAWPRTYVRLLPPRQIIWALSTAFSGIGTVEMAARQLKMRQVA